MARLNSDLVKFREARSVELFKDGKTPKQVNALLADEFGGVKMGLKRLYELRELVRSNGEAASPVAEEATEESKVF